MRRAGGKTYPTILPQIDLGTDDQTRNTRAVVMDLGEPLLLDVLERRGRGHTEADQEHVRLGVAQRAESIVVLLTCRFEHNNKALGEEAR